VVCSKAAAEDAQNQILIAISLRQLMQEKTQQLSPDDIELVFNTSLDCLNNLHSPANEQMGKVLESAIRIHP
jgi:hypothetical protein